jgi:hypothetical protein
MIVLIESRAQSRLAHGRASGGLARRNMPVTLRGIGPTFRRPYGRCGMDTAKFRLTSSMTAEELAAAPQQHKSLPEQDSDSQEQEL